MSEKPAPRFRRRQAYLVKAAETRPQGVAPAEGEPRLLERPSGADIALAREVRDAQRRDAQRRDAQRHARALQR